MALWVAGSDALVRAALRRALEGVGDPVPDGAEDEADAWVWDLGPDESAEPWDPANGPPVLALVPDEPRAREALSDGARGVLLRTLEPERLAPALWAIDAGLIVVDDAFAGALLPSPAAPSPAWEVGPLTPREREVLELLAEGLSNPELAEVLGVSVHTVKFHVNAILTKLEAATRTEAVVLAARLGLLTL